jgi:hypothetical protein
MDVHRTEDLGRGEFVLFFAKCNKKNLLGLELLLDRDE